MCGVFGFQWKKPPPMQQRAALLAVLGVTNDSRGGHSWGWWRADSGGLVARGLGDIAPHVLKLADAPSAFAHTRYGTHGDKSVENAHPFTMQGKGGRIIGAHNGVLQNHLSLNFKHKREFAVDSQHIFQHILDGLPLDEIDGYGTIEYVNPAKSKRIFLCRLTDTGVLSVRRCSHGVVWSSDGDHLEAAMAAAGIDSEPVDVKPGFLHYAEGGTLYITETKMAVSKPATYYDWRSGSQGRSVAFESYWSRGKDDDDEVIDLRERRGKGEPSTIELDDPYESYALELEHDLAEMEHAEFFDKYAQTKFEAREELEEARHDAALAEADEKGSEDPEMVNRALAKVTN